MQIIQNGRHDVIDKYISLVLLHKQRVLMVSCHYAGVESIPVGARRETLRIT